MNRFRLVKRFCTGISHSSDIKIEHLTHRAIVRVSGPHSAQFMQGLITNDMNHLTERNIPSMYTMFLNNRGRVLYDSIMYTTQNPDTFLIECDLDVAEDVKRHLKLYRIRRNVKIEALGSEYKIWVIYDRESTAHSDLSKPLSDLREQFACPCTDPKNPISEHSDFYVFRDPRLAALGLRLITKKNYNIAEIIKTLGLTQDAAKLNDINYRKHRYSLGIGEGHGDLPPETCFPLEANGDYLHAVSFNKGCYLGQELTARTYHTGVIRKRLMPLYLENKLNIDNIDNPIINVSNEAKTSVGKLRGVDGTRGLALLRIEPALAAQKLDVNGIASKTQKPDWWPKEAKSV